ncbi:uncharacterized protein [Paramisgurnus dabryanus]|uniref:uncharacterized protein isoform X2 n=1 Tax=Paramisgurnus dabryanus TaxID=90735 RepID=UPI0031F3468C
MAAPRGVKLKDLMCDFTGNTAPDASPDAQGEYGKSDIPIFELDVGKTSDVLHGGLEPSILSIFQEKGSPGEMCSRMDAESEASLLSALTEILDSVDVETLSPFDTLPDSEIFSAHGGRGSTLLFPEREGTFQGLNISQPPNLKSGKDVVVSDRQLRPRHQSVTSHPGDGERNLKKSKIHSVRTFRMESDPMFPQDELEFLLDLVRHMHPYCLRTHLEKDGRTTDVHVSSEDEEVFVDVEGYEEQEENIPDQSEQLSGKDSGFAGSEESNKDSSKMPQRSALVKNNNVRRTKKRVSFAVHLTLVYEIPPEDEKSESDLPESPSLEDSPDKHYNPECVDSETLSSKTDQMCDIPSPQKPRSLSLQQYRLLRQNKQLPEDERRLDHRTKWPSIPNVPRELPPILPDFKAPQLNLKTLQTDAINSKRASFRSNEITRSSRRDVVKAKITGRKSSNKHICVDPPNPTIVPLKSTQLKPDPTTAAETHPETLETSELLNSSSCEEAGPPSENEPMGFTIKPETSAPGSPQRVTSDQKRPTNITDGHSEDQQNQTEIGIEATDLTSLLEQFETQACEGQMISEVSTDERQDRCSQPCRMTDLCSTEGLTPPATPPHQTWKPLLPVKVTKPESKKASPSKTIQIIEPRPLPPSKVHSKPPLPSFTPALNPAQTFIDHDYCGTTDALIQSSRASHSDKSLPKTDHLSSSVLLSPDSSPCRTDAFESLRFSSRSPTPKERGRTRRRGYRYRRSNSSSGSSCSSCSSSSSSSRSRSRSPPKKRYRMRHSGSSSSSRSSSRSPSRSPPRKRGRHLTRSRSRSLCRSRSGSRSPERDWNEKRGRWHKPRKMNRHNRNEEARKICQQKAIEERRVVYVGGIRRSMLPSDLKDRFSLFGEVEDCTIHLRSHRDNYGFVTYYNADDAFAAIENGSKLRRADERPFDICFGGRRQFCKSDYADLDSRKDDELTSSDSVDFDTLLRQAQRGTRR